MIALATVHLLGIIQVGNFYASCSISHVWDVVDFQFYFWFGFILHFHLLLLLFGLNLMNPPSSLSGRLN